MAQNKKTKKTKKTKRKMDRASLIILIGGAFIIIPFLVLGWILISASLGTGNPIFGSRYDGDLDPAITKEQLAEVETKIEGNSGVESVSINLASATLRVSIDITDSASEEDAQQMLEKAYDQIMASLPVDTYFTSAQNRRMYDLEIHVYNLKDNRDSDNFVYKIRTKNSMMNGEPVDQLVSEPIDAELAQELRDDVENRLNPTPTPETDEMTVGGADDGNEEGESEESEGTAE